MKIEPNFPNKGNHKHRESERNCSDFIPFHLHTNRFCRSGNGCGALVHDDRNGAWVIKPDNSNTDIYCLHRIVMKAESGKSRDKTYPFYGWVRNPAFFTPQNQGVKSFGWEEEKLMTYWANSKSCKNMIFSTLLST